jgi:hypothetical protein
MRLKLGLKLYLIAIEFKFFIENKTNQKSKTLQIFFRIFSNYNLNNYDTKNKSNTNKKFTALIPNEEQALTIIRLKAISQSSFFSKASFSASFKIYFF